MAPCGAVLSRAVPPPRCFLLGEIEKEEKEKVWYYAQLQSLSKRLEELPHVETVSGDPWGGPGGVPPPPHLTWPCAHPPPPLCSSPCRWTSSGSSCSSRRSTSER